MARLRSSRVRAWVRSPDPPRTMSAAGQGEFGQGNEWLSADPSLHLDRVGSVRHGGTGSSKVVANLLSVAGIAPR